MIWFILYILVAAAAAFALYVASVKTGAYNPRYDVPWPVPCGILWPLAGPFAVAYIAAKWYLNKE